MVSVAQSISGSLVSSGESSPPPQPSKCRPKVADRTKNSPFMRRAYRVQGNQTRSRGLPEFRTNSGNLSDRSNFELTDHSVRKFYTPKTNPKGMLRAFVVCSHIVRHQRTRRFQRPASRRLAKIDCFDLHRRTRAA